MSPVDRAKYPDATQNMRFERFGGAAAAAMPSAVPDAAAASMPAADTGRGAASDEIPPVRLPGDKEEECEIDPKVDAFIMADTYAERLAILESVRHRVTDDMLTSMSIVCDIALNDGSVEEKYESLHKALATHKKFEVTRLR